MKAYTYLGLIGESRNDGFYSLEQRNKFSVGEKIEVMKPDGQDVEVTVRAMTDVEGQSMESCPHPKQKLYVDLGIELSPFDLLRRQDK